MVGPALPPPSRWGRPGVLLAFSVACAGCVSRAVPWLRRLDERHGEALVLAAVHTAYGRATLPRAEVAAALERFLPFSRLTTPVALDLTGEWAAANDVEGTPHWLAYDESGRRIRSIFGSQANAITRLDYLVDELLGH
jgi:YD repeat-containing protein